MNVRTLMEKLQLSALNTGDLERIVTGGYTCDLLSWVIGRAGENDAWITIMTNVNTVAVALLANISCIILAENCELDDIAQKKAQLEGVNVLRSRMKSFELSYEIGRLLAEDGS